MTDKNIQLVKGAERKMAVADLPLVAYSLNCGHVGRDYGIQKKDNLFCAKCGSDSRVSKILAQ